MLTVTKQTDERMTLLTARSTYSSVPLEQFGINAAVEVSADFRLRLSVQQQTAPACSTRGMNAVPSSHVVDSAVRATTPTQTPVQVLIYDIHYICCPAQEVCSILDRDP